MIAAACLAALLTAQGADLATTARLHAHGYREGNPLLPQSMRGIVAVKAGATTALVLTGWRLRTSHPRLVPVCFLAGAVSGTLGTWHNSRLRRPA